MRAIRVLYNDLVLRVLAIWGCITKQGFGPKLDELRMARRKLKGLCDNVITWSSDHESAKTYFLSFMNQPLSQSSVGKQILVVDQLDECLQLRDHLGALSRLAETALLIFKSTVNVLVDCLEEGVHLLDQSVHLTCRIFALVQSSVCHGNLLANELLQTRAGMQEGFVVESA